MNAVLTNPEARPDSSGCDVAHRREQDRVERDARAEAQQEHAREHVDEVAAVDRCAGEQRQPGGGGQQPGHERRLDAEAHDELAETATERMPMMMLAGRKERPTCSGL